MIEMSRLFLIRPFMIVVCLSTLYDNRGDYECMLGTSSKITRRWRGAVSLPIDRHIINIMYFHFHFRHFSVKYMHLDSYKEVLEIIREERFLIPEL